MHGPCTQRGAAAQSESAPAPSPVEVFTARAEARALLWYACWLDLHEAVDVLQADAERCGLVSAIGQNAVQTIMARTFAVVRDCKHSKEPERRIMAKAHPITPKQSYGLANREVMRDDVSLDRTLDEPNKQVGATASTLKAAEYLVSTGDRKQFRAWLARLSDAEREGIRQHFKRKKKQRATMTPSPISPDETMEIIDDVDQVLRLPGSNGWAREKLDEAEPLPYVDLMRDLVPRRWLIPDRILLGNVHLLSGEGAMGKSTVLKQLSASVVLLHSWIGSMPAETGTVLFISCEEDDDEIRRRMEDVAAHIGSSRAEIIERGLRILSFAGKDAVLCQPDRNGLIRPTPLFERIRHDVLKLRPKLIVLDAAADVFGGKENDRGQTRQFITILRGLAIKGESAVVMAAHPSLTGISTDTGLSGNTAWHNSVRGRMYLKTAPGEDKALRVLEVKKSNYGPISESVLLRWKDGVYIPEPRAGSLEKMTADAEIDHLFLELLRRFAQQGRNVSDKPSVSYAPSRFAEQPEAKARKIGKAAFADAMTRLFAANKIRVATEGPPSHPRNKIVEVGR